MKAALENALIMAAWLEQKSVEYQRRLQPRKLQLLLFLAQYRYGLAQEGAFLMNATFIACQDGPREPNLYAMMAEGGKIPSVLPPPFHLNQFLDQFWMRYDALSVDHLMDEIKSIEAFQRAKTLGEGHIIDLALEFNWLKDKSKNEAQIGNKKMTLKDGRRVEKWRPQRHLGKSYQHS